MLSKFDEELRKGHSKFWAKTYADSIEEHQHAFEEAYRAVKLKDPEQARAELMIHCKSVGGDELFSKHFVFLMENGESSNNPDKQAALYSKIFKEQIEKGKSEIFAHHYADLMAEGEYTELGCFAESAEYEAAINNGKSKKYAAIYAHEMSEYIANYYSSYGEAIESDLYVIEKRKIEKKIMDTDN